MKELTDNENDFCANCPVCKEETLIEQCEKCSALMPHNAQPHRSLKKNNEYHQPPMEKFYQPDTLYKKLFVLEGLDCPHCSAEIEKDVAKLKGVTASSINLVKQILTIEMTDTYGGNILDEITSVVHKHEPDVKVYEKSDSLSANEKPLSQKANANKKSDFKEFLKSDKFLLIRFIIGSLIYAFSFACSLNKLFNNAVLMTMFVAAYVILGADVVFNAIKNILKGKIFDENFLMTVSTIGAFAIGEYPEAVAVMLFYQVGEFLQRLAVKRSRKSISDLMDIRPDSANVYRNGTLTTISPDEISIGETIVIKPGERIPLDGIVTDGESMINTSALTGESVPRKAKIGDTVLSGCINENAVLSVRVTKEYGESTASKIIELVENAAGRKAPAENFITTFSRYYTPVVVIAAVLLGIIPPLFFGGNWAEWIRRCFVFLVISCPCALVISIPLTFFGGIGAASRQGILIKGSNYLEALNYIDTIVFDKTGTLTKGVFEVAEITAENGFSNEELLRYAAQAEVFSNHPIAQSISRAYNKYNKEINKNDIKNYTEISGCGISAVINKKKILSGNEKLMKDNNIIFKYSQQAGTAVYVAVDGTFAGSITISDEIKPDSKQAVSDLKKSGIKNTVMLTGDDITIAKHVAQSAGIDEFYSGLLPDEKVKIFEKLDSEKPPKKKIAFVGDGINDAPVLARADVGIAMGALGSDAAIEAADVVLMTDEPSKLVNAVKTARFTKKVVMQNIIMVIAVKIIFLILGAFGIAGMWEAVFGDVGIMILAVINSTRLLFYNKNKK